MTDKKMKKIFIYTQSAEHKIDKEENLIYFLKNQLDIHYSKDEYLINFIFLSENDITEMNQRYLGHNHATDVITFDFSEDFGVFGGDVFICPQVVAENAVLYKVSYQIEMLRVICHGMLHLLGFDDKNEELAEEIHAEEDLCIVAFKKQEKL